MRDASLGIRRRVVVQNLPPVSALLEEERERSARRHRVAARKPEACRAEREIECEGTHPHLGERERVAALTGREVRGLIVVVQRLPTVLHVPVGHVAREGIPRVVAHEAGEVAAVPIAGAPLEHARDLGLRISGGDPWGRAGEHGQRGPRPRTSRPRHRHRLEAPFKGDAKRAAGAPRGDGSSHPKRRSRAVTSKCFSGGASSPPSAASSCRPAWPGLWAASCRPSSSPWVSPAFSASSPASAAAPSSARPSSAQEWAASWVPADTSAPSSRSHSSCSPKNPLTRASDDLSSLVGRWAWPIAYPGNAPT